MASVADHFMRARQNMIDGQLLPNKILDERVLEVMGTLPREMFVPDALRGNAYIDEEIDLPHGRRMTAPLVLARMLQLAQVAATETVLHVGCATGYATAALAHFAKRVVAVEEQRELADKARQSLNHLGIHNAEVVTAPHFAGHVAAAPYDLIFIDGAVSTIPASLTHQLADGGRLVMVENIEQSPGVSGLGKMTLVRRMGDSLFRRKECDASATLLPGFEQKPHFVF